jgi:hypothetical protein
MVGQDTVRTAKVETWRLPLLLGSMTALCGSLMLGWIWRFGVDVPAWDQWDFLQPAFRGEGYWAIFHYRHGPHYQGVGGVLTYLLYLVTGWDIRAEMLLMGLLLMVNAALLLWLKHRLFREWHASDLVLVLTATNPIQYECIFSSPNASHSIMPLTLGVAMALCLTQSNAIRRMVGLIPLGFLALFTGFGLFFWMGGLIVLALNFTKDRRLAVPLNSLLPQAIGLGVWIGMAVFFLWGYHPDTTTAYPFGTLVRPLEYVLFLLFLPGTIFHWSNPGQPSSPQIYLTMAWGLCFWIVLIVAFTKAWRRLETGRFDPREVQPVHRVIVLFAATSLCYAVFNAFGRAPSGPYGATASRYYTLLMPVVVALYFLILHVNWKPMYRRSLTSLLALSFVVNSVAARNAIHALHDLRAGWVEVYRETLSLETAEARYPSAVYPGGGVGNANVESGLRYLHQHGYSLFRER